MNIEIKTNEEGSKYFALYNKGSIVVDGDLCFGQEFINQYSQDRGHILQRVTEQYKLDLYEEISQRELLGMIAIEFLRRTHHNTFYQKLKNYNPCWSVDISYFQGQFRAWGTLFHALQFINKEGYYDGLSKLHFLNNLYQECGTKMYIDEFYFKDIKKIDQTESHQRQCFVEAKISDNEQLMKSYIATIFDNLFVDFVQYKGYDAICVLPNNLQRTLNFNDEVASYLQRRLPNISFVQVLIQDFPERVPQKSIELLRERIVNAEKLLSVESFLGKDYKNIFIIDDVFGSGATINVVAEKIKKQLPEVAVTGFTILSSYRDGFDVLSVSSSNLQPSEYILLK